MQWDEYIHKQDIYQVANRLLLMSAGYDPRLDSGRPVYDLSDLNFINAPKFSDQRRVLKWLDENRIIKIVECYSKFNKPTTFNSAVRYTFKPAPSDKLPDLLHQLLSELSEANLNYLSHKDMLTASLEIDGEYVYVLLPLIKLRLNSKPLRQTSTPIMFLEYLLNQDTPQIMTRSDFPQKTSRKFGELLSKAGFTGIVRRTFVRDLTDDQVLLLKEVDASNRVIVDITRYLLRNNEYNQRTYRYYVSKNQS